MSEPDPFKDLFEKLYSRRPGRPWKRGKVERRDGVVYVYDRSGGCRLIAGESTYHKLVRWAAKHPTKKPRAKERP